MCFFIVNIYSPNTENFGLERMIEVRSKYGRGLEIMRRGKISWG